MLQLIQQLKMTLKNCKIWLKKFEDNGRIEEAEEMRKRILLKEPVSEPKETIKSKGKR